mmetsp:Transcript_16491/g.23115  ORF Transcript_16491/g.23115 Transcript_16491/m.23115 type:complete len:84 (+) Transcript_16491:111-362(+)
MMMAFKASVWLRFWRNARVVASSSSWSPIGCYGQQRRLAGHSKWANIQHRKKAQDSKRNKYFNKMSKAITAAAKEGDESVNPR